MSDLLHFSDQLLMLGVIAAGSVLVALLVRRQERWVFGLVPYAACLAAGSLLAIMTATLTRRGEAREPGHLQLRPLHTIAASLDDPSSLVIYVLGNVALFMPLGFFLHLAIRRSIVTPAALTVAASIGVELAQLPIWSRSTDVDDVLLNSLGGILGVLTAWLVLAVAPQPWEQHWRTQPDWREYDAPDPDRAVSTLLPMGERR
jgi:glycopeptide antibiotics resistance protein